MYFRITGIMALAALCGGLGLGAARPQAAGSYRIVEEIAVDGPALFYGVEGDTRTELWSVHCLQPLRGCVARAPGLVLRLDGQGRPWLIAATAPGARISVRSGGRIRQTSQLLSTPLDTPGITRLSARDGAVIVKEGEATLLHTPTAGLARVLDYLRWINGNTARILRDARLWPKNGEIRIQDMSPEVLERYEVMQRRALEAARRPGPLPARRTRFATAAAPPPDG